MCTTLHEAIKEGNAKEALRLLGVVDPVKAQVKDPDDCDRLLLHQACRRSWIGFNETIIFQVISKLIEIYPKAVEVKDRFNNLPIHYAVRCITAKPLEFLDSRFPKGLATPGYQGMLPLHMLLANPHFDYNRDLSTLLLENTRMLVKECPQSLEVKDHNGMLPIHCAAEQQRDPETVKVLVDATPKALRQETNQGSLPIHEALDQFKSSDNLASLVEYMVKMYPESLKHADSEGNLPIHIAVRRAGNWGFRGNSICNFLISHYPEGLMCLNKSKDVPLACASKDTVFENIARHCPASILQPCTSPFQPAMKFLRANNVPQCRIQVLAKALKMALQKATSHNTTKGESEEQRALVQKVKDLDMEKAQLEKDLESKEQLALTRLQKMKDLTKEKEQLEKTHAQEVGELNRSHTDEKDKISKSHADEKEQLKQSFATEIKQVKDSFDIYKQIVAASRALDKTFLSKLQDPENNKVSMEELKSFATSLKDRIDIVRAKTNPKAGPSMMQTMFPTFITHPQLSRASLIECILGLDEELTGLEADMEDTTGDCPTRNIQSTRAAPPVATGGEEPSRQAKRPRVSLP